MPPLAEITQLIVFGVLALAVVVGALGVVMLPNIVYAAFLLGGVFLSVAGLYLMLNASFIAAAQILIYVGAVNVLILFAIMLVNKKEAMGASPGVGLRRLDWRLHWLICSAAPRGLQHPLGHTGTCCHRRGRCDPTG